MVLLYKLENYFLIHNVKKEFKKISAYESKTFTEVNVSINTFGQICLKQILGLFNLITKRLSGCEPSELHAMHAERKD